MWKRASNTPLPQVLGAEIISPLKTEIQDKLEPQTKPQVASVPMCDDIFYFFCIKIIAGNPIFFS